MPSFGFPTHKSKYSILHSTVLNFFGEATLIISLTLFLLAGRCYKSYQKKEYITTM